MQVTRKSISPGELARLKRELSVKSSATAQANGIAKDQSDTQVIIEKKRDEQSNVPKEAKLPVLPLGTTPADSASETSYPGDSVYPEDNEPLKDEYQTLAFESPAEFLTFFHRSVHSGQVTLHPWQIAVSDQIAEETPKATSLKPYKLALCAANGSGKDAFVVAPFVLWFALCHKHALCIVTSSSGNQLTAQTENYIKGLAEAVNGFFGTQVFRIRQRYIKCLLSGSEIRLFATDEAGKAEGYHPLEPGAKFAIVVNEAKSVSEEIFDALRRCTGYTHWLNVSTPGEPKGSFYRSFCNWPNARRVTSYDCSHLSPEDREEDKRDFGEHSALFRSKHLALFTTISSEVVIPRESVNYLLEHPPKPAYANWEKRVGIDLAAGGDENCVTITHGNVVVSENAFREADTTITADRIEKILLENKIPKHSEFIFADDGGIGRGIIDTLVRRGWNIKRVLNQARATNSSQYGNKGAELWYRVRRFVETRCVDLRGLSTKTIDQLTDRRFKQSSQGGRILLEAKRDAKAEGRSSPDRADAYVLSQTGLTLEDYGNVAVQDEAKPDARQRTILRSNEAVLQHYEDELDKAYTKSWNFEMQAKKRVFNSLRAVINN